MNSPLDHIIPTALSTAVLNGPITQEGLALSLAPITQNPPQSHQDGAGALTGPSPAPQVPYAPRSAPDSIKALSQILRILAPLPPHTRNAIIGFILAEYPLQ